MPARDFAAVYDEHLWRVYGFFGYRLSSRADAEDLTQITFEKALRAWSRYDPERASISTWLLVIARNVLTDHLRARGTEITARPGEDSDWELVAAPEDTHSLGLDPRLERALQALSARERELIALRFGGDLTGPEIAELTGLNLDNVHQILSRALRRLRASLDAATVEVA